MSIFYLAWLGQRYKSCSSLNQGTKVVHFVNSQGEILYLVDTADLITSVS